MSIPRYIAIADELTRQIISGDMLPDSKFPSQRDLADVHKTTLMTVRQALAYLEEQGLIYSRHGVGTFVSRETLDDLHLMSFSDEMGDQDCAICTETLSKAYDVLYEPAAYGLGRPSDQTLCKLERLRKVNDLPVVYQTSYLSKDLRKAVETYSGEQSLYGLAGTIAEQRFTMAREAILPTIVTEPIASLMVCKPGTPAFLSKRLSFGLDGKPLVYDEAIILGKYFAITTERLGRRRNFMYHVLDTHEQNVLDLLQN